MDCSNQCGRYSQIIMYNSHSDFPVSTDNNENNNNNKNNSVGKEFQRPIIVGSSAIAISSVGALSLFLFLEKNMKARPARRLHKNTIHARIRE